MDPTTIQSWLTAASTIAAAISALAAWQALKLGYENRKFELENGRPYFSFESARMEQKKLPNAPGNESHSGLDPNTAVAKGIFKNYGARPAVGVKATAYVIPHDENISPLAIPSSLADDFPPGAEWMTQIGEQQIVAPNQYGHFLVVGIRYSDPVTKQDYRQMFFMKWAGVKDSIVYGDIVAATEEEKFILLGKHMQLFAQHT